MKPLPHELCRRFLFPEDEAHSGTSGTSRKRFHVISETCEHIF